jgi:protein SSD1
MVRDVALSVSLARSRPVRTVVKWLAEHSGDAHMVQMRQNAERHAKLMEASDSKASDESELFADDGASAATAKLDAATSKQAKLSRNKVKPVFEGVEVLQPGGHHVQTIREFQTVPVICSADMTKSPPVIKVRPLLPRSFELVCSAAHRLSVSTLSPEARPSFP